MEKFKIIVIDGDGKQIEKEVYKIVETQEEYTNLIKKEVRNKEKQIEKLTNELEAEKITRSDKTLSEKLLSLGVKENLVEITKKLINPNYDETNWEQEVKTFLDNHQEFSAIQPTASDNTSDNTKVEKKSITDSILEDAEAGLFIN